MPGIEDTHTEMVWTRVDSVVTLILENEKYLQKKRTPELTTLVMEKYGIETRQAQRYISEAKREVRKLGREKTEAAFKKALRDREYLLSKAKKKDYKLALEIIKDREKLLGLYPDAKIKNENVNYSIDLSRLTEKGLERIKRGDDPKEVILDPECVIMEDAK